MFGRVPKVPDAVIDQIEADESKVSEKCYFKCSLRSCNELLTHDVDKLLFSKVIRIEKLFDLNNVFYISLKTKKRLVKLIANR